MASRFHKHLVFVLALIGVLLLCSAFTTAQASSQHEMSGGKVSAKVYAIQAVPLRELHSVHPALRAFSTMQQAYAALSPNSIILGTLYQNANYGGRDLLIYGSSCNDEGVSSLVPYNFNDITSSLFNGCHSVTLYFNVKYSGPHQTYGNGGTSYVGKGMNDQASSVLFHS
jgi:hypothetical protein